MQTTMKVPSLSYIDDTDLSHLRARVERLSSLIEVSIIINSSLDVDEVLNLVMEKAQSVMHAEASAVMLLNEETGYLEFESALGEVGSQVKQTIKLKMGEGIAGWVAQTGKPVIVPDVQSDPRFANKVDKQTGFVTRSILAVPLIVKGKVIGVAEVLNRVDGRAFTEDDLHLFMTFGRQVALAIENARMHQFMLQQQKFEQQLEAARTIQESFLPQAAPRDSQNRFSVAARSHPATFIGGDLYDFIEFEDDSLGLVMGDVAGKGIPAALYMARLVSDFRFYAQTEKDPAHILTIINNLLVERAMRGMFVTLQYMRVDIASGLARVATAGHLPILRLRRQERTCAAIELASGAPLGIMRNMPFQTDSVQLAPGDTLVCYTDGVIEAKNRRGQQFGIDRLTDLIAQSESKPDLVVDRVFKSVKEHSRRVSQHDDITVLAFTWYGR